MTSKLTREQVIALIAEHSYDSALVDALECLATTMDSEPVAWMLDCVGGTDYSNHPERGGVPLYRHAPITQQEPVLNVQFKNGWPVDGTTGVISGSPSLSDGYHDFYAVAQPEISDDAMENFRTAMEGIGHIRRTQEETFGGMHGTHVEPDVLAECKAICDAICLAYRKTAPQPAPVVQMVPEEPPEHLLPKGSSRDVTHRRGAAIQAWKQCRAAMLQADSDEIGSWSNGKNTPTVSSITPAAPVVTFYRDGIEAAAKWVDQQREAYDNEHGWSDPGTGSFEFGNDAQREYSSTLEELAEGIRALHPNAGNSPAIPDGYVMVPKEPTKEMIDAGWLYFMGAKNPSSKGAYKAMLAAAPQEVK